MLFWKILINGLRALQMRVVSARPASQINFLASAALRRAPCVLRRQIECQTRQRRFSCSTSDRDARGSRARYRIAPMDCVSGIKIN